MPTAGQILINDILPPRYRDYERVLDKKNTKKLLQQIAENDPELYPELLGKLGRFGAKASQRSGGWGLAPDLLQTPEITRKHRERLKARLQAIYDSDDLTPKEKDERVTELTLEAGTKLRGELFEKLKEEGHPSALLVASGAKGNPFALSAGLGFDGLYVDSYDRPQPYPVLHNYSEGLSPFEYWAGTAGARKGVIDPKLMTASSGFLAKQIVTITHRGVVSGTDYPEGTRLRENVGLPVSTDDSESIGSYLAAPVGGYKRNTLITDAVLRDLQRKKITDMLIRSPVVGGPADGSLYAYDIGMGERGRNYVPGENPSVTAGQALSEQITQGALCLSEGTLVRMADFTTKKIQDIRAGDMVLGATEDGFASPVKVLALHENGEKDCWKTRFVVGQTRESVFLESTLDHKVLCDTRHWAPNTEICKTGVFPVGTKCVKLAAKMLQSVYDFDGENEPMALLLGLLLGDGCYRDTVHGAFLSCHDDSLITDTKSYMAQLGLKFSTLKDHYGYYRVSQLVDATATRDTETGQFLQGSRNPCIVKLKELGMWDKYAYDKVLPPEVYSWSKTSIASLIGGLIASDGSIYVTRKTEHVAVNFGSTSETLATQIRDLLRVRFGIYCSDVYRTDSGRKRTLYSFNISRRPEVERFAELIPVPGVKRERARKLLDIYPKKYKDVCRFYRREQEPIGVRRTYDLEVDSDSHLFVLANGLIVHNSSKHTGGVAGGTAKAVAGFKAINQMLQSPSHWEGAIHSQEDGKVTSVKPDELGNTVVTINGKEHIIPGTHKATVKPGDFLEAGDTLSDGLPNPAEIVKHQGIGQGRVTYVKALGEAMRNGGVDAPRRNIELVARGLINHIHIDKEHGDYLTGDVVPYSKYEAEYSPRPEATKGRPEHLKDQYLEEPVLHYTIGTKLRPSVLANLKRYNIKQVVAHKEPPPFQSQFVRAMANAAASDDWLTRMGGSYQKRSILEAAQKGMTSDPFGPSYIPAIVARTDFTKRQPGQPDPIIKSILPHLPKKQTVIPEYELDPKAKKWFDVDGDLPPDEEEEKKPAPQGGWIGDDNA